MNTNASNSELHSIVSTFTTNLENHFRANARASIEAAFAGLSNGAKSSNGATKPGLAKTRPVAGIDAPVATKAPKAKTGRKGKKTRTKTDPAALAKNVATLLAFVKKNPGARSEEVRAGIGLEKAAYLKAVGAAVIAKQLVKKGEKRATTLRCK